MSSIIKRDVIFKAFSSRKGNEKFLINFLSALLNIKIYKFRVMPEVSVEKLSEQEKGGSMDILIEINDDTIVNIEMQQKDNKNIEERTTYYSSKIISRDVRRRN